MARKHTNTIVRPALPASIPVSETVQGDIFEVVTAVVASHVGLVCIKGWADDGEHNYVCLSDGEKWGGSPSWTVRLLDRVTITRDCVPTPTPMPAPVAPITITAAERNCLERGHRIVAIKSIRERTGFGLKEAKELADKLVPIPVQP
jgi:hypothetical protein